RFAAIVVTGHSWRIHSCARRHGIWREDWLGGGPASRRLLLPTALLAGLLCRLIDQEILELLACLESGNQPTGSRATACPGLAACGITVFGRDLPPFHRAYPPAAPAAPAVPDRISAQPRELRLQFVGPLAEDIPDTISKLEKGID
ncbi:MAG TPA: hypothetical protein VKE72_01315, partial [Methylocella sp.]|nr:hypothetical protein [Methylocella sp.]